jgi:hypothetical protein
VTQPSTASKPSSQSSPAAGGCCQGGEACPPKAPLTREQVAALPTHEMIARYRMGVENFDPRIFALSEEQLDMAFLPDANVGQWPVRVLLGHLADADLVFSHRMRRAFAEQNPVLAVWDENAFIDSGLYSGADPSKGRMAQPIGGYVAVLHTLRRWTSEWLMSLSEEDMARKAMHPERGPQSIRTILSYAAWHLEHHAAYLNAKVCRMLGAPQEAPRAKSGAGGCGPGCGCAQ